MSCGVATRKAHGENGPYDLVSSACVYQIRWSDIPYFASGNPYRWSNTREKDIARDFSYYVADSPRGLHIIQFIPIKRKLFFPTNSVSERRTGQNQGTIHARHKCIIDIRLVKVFDEVTYVEVIIKNRFENGPNYPEKQT